VSNNDVQQLSNELVVLSARLVREVRRHTPDLPAASTRLLSLLDELGPSTIGDLAKADRCSQPTMSGLVKGIGAKGWVTRSAHPQDARSSLVTLTDRGREVLTELRRRNADVVAARARATEVSPDDLSGAVALLSRLLARD
jgi:DNA-binding MarR family transcriptional regulator